MKKILLVLLALLFVGCGVSKSVPKAKVYGNIDAYTRVYVTPAGSAAASSVGVGVGGVYEGTTSASSPSDIIRGYLMKKGYTIVPEIKPEQAKYTMIATYGQVKSSMDLISEITAIIQLTDAETQQLIASCEASGSSAISMSEALVRAIENAMNAIFQKQ